MKGSDVKLWKIEKVFYFNIFFNSVEDLMDVYSNGFFYKVFFFLLFYLREFLLFLFFFCWGKL